MHSVLTVSKQNFVRSLYQRLDSVEHLVVTGRQKVYGEESLLAFFCLEDRG
jgi:hypothetical protein